MSSRVKLPVLDKKQNYTLFQSKAFGNKLRDWRTPSELRAAKPQPETVSLRTLMGGNGPCYYHLTPGQALWNRDLWIRRFGIAPDNIVFGEMAPNDAIVLQGEYLNGATIDPSGEPRLGKLFFSRHQEPMRKALRCDARTVYGLQALATLQEAMTPSSWSDFSVLLEQYPGHVLEVSVYSREVGDTPWRNAIVWEVRSY